MRISDWSSDVCSSDLRNTSARDLARTGPPPELGDQFMNLTQPGGRNRMTFRLETSRRIDRNSSPQGGLPSSRNPPTLTHLAEAEILDLTDLGKRRRIVNPSTEERREGKECVGTCRSRGAPEN